MDNLSTLNESEVVRLTRLYIAWEKAKFEKKWKVADMLRFELCQWDESITKFGSWHSIFESKEHRRARSTIRKQQK